MIWSCQTLELKQHLSTSNIYMMKQPFFFLMKEFIRRGFYNFMIKSWKLDSWIKAWKLINNYWLLFLMTIATIRTKICWKLWYLCFGLNMSTLHAKYSYNNIKDFKVSVIISRNNNVRYIFELIERNGNISKRKLFDKHSF